MNTVRIKCDVDLDWIGEDGSISDEGMRMLIDGVVLSISEASRRAIVVESRIAAKAATDALAGEVHRKAREYVESYLNNDACVTDCDGDVLSVDDLIKKTFSDMLNNKVDSEGKASNGYNGKQSLLKHIIEVKSKDLYKKFSKRNYEEKWWGK